MRQELESSSSIENAEIVRKTAVFKRKQRFLWSEWGDSNSRHLEPKSSALPTGPHPDIEFEAEKEILTVVVKTVVKPQF